MKTDTVIQIEGKYSHSIFQNQIELYLLGTVYDINSCEVININQIIQMYREHNEEIYQFLDGTYSLIIRDMEKHCLYVFHDYLGANQNIYYGVFNNILYVSNCLKNIIRDCEKQFFLNENVVETFLRNGYITGAQTLIKDIYKVPPRIYMMANIDNGQIKLLHQKEDYLKNENMYIEDVSDYYVDILKRICLSSYRDHIVTTISSGYDTNLLLYLLANNTQQRISSFCVGGIIGRNEIPDANAICECYSNVSFYSTIVNSDSFCNMPEIVYALEGAIYESGIFLQYELANLINAKKQNELIAGECADQILNIEFYDDCLMRIKKNSYDLEKNGKGIYYKPYKDPFEMAAYKILKKNGILMNYKGIDVNYPYLRVPFIRLARCIVVNDKTEKEFHKNIVSNLLKPNISRRLKKLGGATELKALFTGDIQLENIRLICKNSVFYQEHIFDDVYYEIDYCLKIVYLELFIKIFLNQDKKYLQDKWKGYDLAYFFPQLGKAQENE